MSKWIWIKFEGAVGHLVEERYASAVRADLIARDCGELESDCLREPARFYLDMGGPILMGEPTETLLEIDGLTVSVRSLNVGGFAERAERLEPRAGGYVKLHSMYSCLCMSPEQRDRLVAELRRIDEWAHARADRHFKQWRAGRDAG